MVGVLDALARAGIRVWLDGGWGVDALLGEQTRVHDDLDIVVELNRVEDTITALTPHGFVLRENVLPTRAVLRSEDGRQIDMHPITFDGEGTGWQAGAMADGTDCPYPASGFGTGRIHETVVPCLTPDLQVQHHRGYAPRDRDRADMARLAARFDLTLPAPY